MTEKRNLTVLLAGLILIVCGAVFLAVNIWRVSFHWGLALKILIPSLLLLAGLLKLIRHFTWTEEELLARPGKAGLLGGIFWSSLGLVLLLDLFGSLEALRFFGSYWPMILIVYGLGKIVDYYRLKRASRVRMAEIFGVVFIAFFGWSVTKISEAHLPLVLDLGWREFPWKVSWESPVAKQRFKTSQALDVQGVRIVEVRNIYGDVEIRPAEGDSATVELLKIVRNDSESMAEKLAGEVSIVEDRQEETLFIGTNRRELGDRGKQLNTHLVLRLPEDLQTRITNSYGDIAVEDRNAACQLENSYGQISAQDIVGDVVINGNYQRIEAEDIEGNLTVTNRRAPVSVNNINGNVDISTDYDRVSASVIRGNLSVQNRFGRVLLEEISGTADVQAKGSRVSVDEVGKAVRISNSYKPVFCSGLSNALTIDTSYSEVEVSDVTGPVEIRSAHSEVSAEEIEKGLRLQGLGSLVEISGVRGELVIETTLRSVGVEDFSGPLAVQNEYGQVSVASPENLSGPIRITNKNGEIMLSLPETTNCILSAQSVGGGIMSDFGPEPQKSEGKVSLLKTRIGAGGPQIELQTTQARIQIRKRG